MHAETALMCSPCARETFRHRGHPARWTISTCSCSSFVCGMDSWVHVWHLSSLRCKLTACIFILGPWEGMVYLNNIRRQSAGGDSSLERQDTEVRPRNWRVLIGLFALRHFGVIDKNMPIGVVLRGFFGFSSCFYISLSEEPFSDHPILAALFHTRSSLLYLYRDVWVCSSYFLFLSLFLSLAFLIVAIPQGGIATGFWETSNSVWWRSSVRSWLQVSS